MGSLAMWSGLAGAGKGVDKAIDYREKRDAADLDYKRQAALERMRQRHAENLQAQSQAFTSSENEMNREWRTGERVGGQEFTAKENAADRGSRESTVADTLYSQDRRQEQRLEFEAEENQKNRDSREKIAGWASNAKNKTAYGDRFESKDLSKTQMNQWGIAVGRDDIAAVYDKAEGIRYLQIGDKLILAGDNQRLDDKGNVKPSVTADGRTAVPTSKAMELLESDPQGKGTYFYQMYGYLPSSYLKMLHRQQMSQLTSASE